MFSNLSNAEIEGNMGSPCFKGIKGMLVDSFLHQWVVLVNSGKT